MIGEYYLTERFYAEYVYIGPSAYISWDLYCVPSYPWKIDKALQAISLEYKCRQVHNHSRMYQV